MLIYEVRIQFATPRHTELIIRENHRTACLVSIPGHILHIGKLHPLFGHACQRSCLRAHHFTSLHIYIFKQANAYIAYCPSIDLAVSGNSIRNAEKSFQESVSIHLDYQIKNKELLKDLKKHKWKVRYHIKNKKSR